MNQLLHFLNIVIRSRLDFELGKDKVLQKPEVDLHLNKDKALGKFIFDHQIGSQDLLLLILALVPHIDPGFFNKIVSDYFPKGGEFPEFGGTKAKNHRGIIPTGETALYILAGSDPDTRIKYLPVFQESILFRKGILSLQETSAIEPVWSGAIVLDDEYADRFLTEKVRKPQLSTAFPAQLIETDLDWKDLVLNQKVLDQIHEIETWVNHHEELMNRWKMKGRIKPGFRVMLFGPSGTGKTLTASLLGKYTNRDVYRIDLSMVISKYIGETEKNLSNLFDRAKNKDWILFFDEADAVFGKRTNVKDAHDKYANQEVSYLLQKIESHPGLVILASNFKNNIDASFTRRFQSIIEFTLPNYDERLQLWQTNLPEAIPLEDKADLEQIAKKYALTGANIINVIQYAALKTIEDKNPVILEKHLLHGIKKEYLKEGKMFS